MSTSKKSRFTIKRKGIRLFKKPATKKIGGWVEMAYDAFITRYGLKWYRVKGGFGNYSEDSGRMRESWILSVPLGCFSVDGSTWVSQPFDGGPSREIQVSNDVFEAAIVASIRAASRDSAGDITKYRDLMMQAVNTNYDLLGAIVLIERTEKKI